MKKGTTGIILIAALTFAFGWFAFWSFSTGAKLAFDLGGQASSDKAAASLPAQAGSAIASLPTPAPSTPAAASSSAEASKMAAPSMAGAKSLTIMMGGDVMFDRDIRKIGESSGYDSLFASLAPLFKTVDIAAVNLEGPITTNDSRTLLRDGSDTGKLSFTFAPTTATVLAHAGITLVSLANNHTDNFGQKGVSETENFLKAANVQWFGNPWNDPPTETTIEKNGIKVAFVGYHSFQPGFDRVIAAIKSLKGRVDFIIVMPHWGQEYETHTTDDLRAKAQALVDAGADAIVGSHPHVIMDHEWIGSVPVFYSLGNLIFDQYFSPDVMAGNLVELSLYKTDIGTHINEIHVYKTSFASHRYTEIDGDPTVVSPGL